MYDALVVGAGLCGAVFAQRLHEAGCFVLVVNRQKQIGGNVYTEERFRDKKVTLP